MYIHMSGYSLASSERSLYLSIYHPLSIFVSIYLSIYLSIFYIINIHTHIINTLYIYIIYILYVCIYNMCVCKCVCIHILHSPHTPQAFNVRQTAYFLGSSGQVLKLLALLVHKFKYWRRRRCYRCGNVQRVARGLWLRLWRSRSVRWKRTARCSSLMVPR